MNENENPQQTAVPHIPPNDPEAEQAVLSCMLFNSDEPLNIACSALVQNDFYIPRHRAIFSAISGLYSKNEEINLITVKNSLEKAGVFEQIGGLEYLSGIAGYVSTWAAIKSYVKIVKEKSVLRQIISAGNNMSSMGFSNDANAEVIIEKTESVFEKLTSGDSSTGFSHIKEVLESAIDEIEENYKSGNKIIGISTGFTDLDFKLSGLQKSDLILVAARPAMGKTAFALNIALNAAIKSNITTAIFSMEMSEEQLASRLICSHAYIDSQKLSSMSMEAEDWNSLAKTAGEISQAPIYISDKTDITVTELRARCRKLKKEKNLGLIVIDYLQLMNGSGGRNDSRQQEISNISRALKNLAIELKVPIVALSQLSRAVEQRPNHRPMLSDLRESGAIEQDADVVCFLYRDEYYNPDTEKRGQAEVIIAKNRKGSVGTVNLMWLGQYTKFENMEHQYTNI